MTTAGVQDAQQYGHDEAMEDLDGITSCAFGPADDCVGYAALWLRVLAERDALLAEHEAVANER